MLLGSNEAILGTRKKNGARYFYNAPNGGIDQELLLCRRHHLKLNL